MSPADPNRIIGLRLHRAANGVDGAVDAVREAIELAAAVQGCEHLVDVLGTLARSMVTARDHARERARTLLGGVTP